MSYDELAVEDVKKCRKNHLCAWCAETISKGAPAIYRAGVFDGDFLSDHFHPECWDACGRFVEAVGEVVSWTPGDFKRGTAVNWSGENYEPDRAGAA